MAINNELLGMTSAQLMDKLEAQHAEGEITGVFIIAQVGGEGSGMLRTAMSPGMRRTELLGMLEVIKHDHLTRPPGKWGG